MRLVTTALSLTNVQNIAFSNFGASATMNERLTQILPQSAVFESGIEAMTSVHGWQQTWDEYHAAKNNAHLDTIHSISGGLIHAMIFLDANPGVTCETMVLESPVWTDADMMALFNQKFTNTKVSPDVYLNRWRRSVTESHHCFTDRYLKPFTEKTLSEFKFAINEKLLERTSRIVVITHENDPLIDLYDIGNLMSTSKHNDIPCVHHRIKGKHAMYSVMKPTEFRALITPPDTLVFE